MFEDKIRVLYIHINSINFKYFHIFLLSAENGNPVLHFKDFGPEGNFAKKPYPYQRSLGLYHGYFDMVKTGPTNNRCMLIYELVF